MGLVADILGYISDQQRNKQQQEQWAMQKEQMDVQTKLIKLGLQEKEQIETYIQSLPKELQGLARTSPKIAGLLETITKRGLGGTPIEQPSTFETQGVPFPRADQLPKQPQPGLGSQIANQQLFGGLNPQDLLMGLMSKEFGIDNPMEAVKSDLPIVGPGGQQEYGQMLRGGMMRPTGVPIPQPIKQERMRITGPRGEEREIFINPYTGEGPTIGGQPGIPTKPAQPVIVGIAQQTEMMKSGFEALKKIKNSIFDPETGTINRKNLANAKMGTPWTEGKRIADLYGSALNAIRIASTGAAFSPKELEELKRQYISDYFAKDQQIYDQWDQMATFVFGMLQPMDPNKVFTKKQQDEFKSLITIPRKGMTTPKASKKYEQLSNEE